MRTSFALKNTIASILVEIVAALSGIILPRFFIDAYGSSVNGLVSSIGQFITYMGLVEAGVSAAATVELYKPLALNDKIKINEIVSAAKGFYLKSGFAFVALDILLIICYPYIIRNEITNVAFIRMMILVLSLNGIVDYFILGKYRVLLTADQKTYIISIAQAIGTVITLAVSIVLIKAEYSSVLVKGVVAAVYGLRTIFIVIYVRKHYDFIDFNHTYSKEAFPQRGSALFHQIVGMICNNTDMVLLTIMLPVNALAEVSVYAVYNMIASNITALFNSISKGLSASYGNILAEGDTKTLSNSYSIFELIYFMLLFIVYTCMGILMYTFVSLYSASFADKDMYIRWDLVALFTLCGLIQNIRIPGMTIQIAAGHYRQTQGAALLEAVINFGLSLSLVRTFGINGVLFGTLVAYLYRSTYVIVYNDHYFVKGTLKRTTFRSLRNFMLFCALTCIGISYLTPLLNSWSLWIIFATITFLGSCIAFFLINFICEPCEIRACWRYIMSVLRRSR